MTSKERLEQYIKEDTIYNKWLDNNTSCVSDFDKFCIQHCLDIKEMLEQNQKYKEAINEITDINNRIIEEYKIEYGDSPSKLLLSLEMIEKILKEVE